MKRFLFIILFCFLSAGCIDNEVEIDLPDGLKWGIKVDDVKAKGISIFKNDAVKDHYNQYYLIKSDSYPELESKMIIFSPDNGLVGYNFSNSYYSNPTHKFDKLYDPNGEKAISLFNLYINKFDELYPSDSSAKEITSSPNFWVDYPCEDKVCVISEKIYKDKIGTVLTISLVIIKSEENINNIGSLLVSFKKSSNKLQ